MTTHDTFSGEFGDAFDRGPVDYESIYALMVPFDAAENFVFDGQPLPVRLHDRLSGIEVPIGELSPHRLGKRYRIVSQFTETVPAENGAMMPLDVQSLAVHGVSLRLPGPRPWRPSPELVRVEIDVLPAEADFLLQRDANP